MKTCYYAHSVALYGTPQEKRDLELLKKIFYHVVNPSDKIYQSGYKAKGGMIYFRDIVQDCHILAFRAHIDGKIGAGVALEIEWAMEYGIPVIELPTMINSRILSIERTKEYLQEIGSR